MPAYAEQGAGGVEGTEAGMGDERNTGDIPEWLRTSQGYDPPSDRDGYVGKSILSVAGVLAHLRLDDGRAAAFSPSAPVKLVVALACILLVSLARNYSFVLLMLALVLVRLAFLPAASLKRAIGVALPVTALTFLLMLPAVFLGQSHSALLVGTKVFVSVGTAMCMALTTPANELTGSLRVFRVPSLFIMTIDLALKNIVRLGETAMEVLTALQLRSVGRNQQKGSSIGGVGGTVFLKSSEAAQATYEAMTCRGFDGDYPAPATLRLRAVDVAWIVGVLVLVAVFVYFQGLV